MRLETPCSNCGYTGDPPLRCPACDTQAVKEHNGCAFRDSLCPNGHRFYQRRVEEQAQKIAEAATERLAAKGTILEQLCLEVIRQEAHDKLRSLTQCVCPGAPHDSQ